MVKQKDRHCIVYIVSHIDKAIGFEWIAEKLNKEHFQLSFILLNDKPSVLGMHLREMGINVWEFPAGSKLKWLFTLLRIIRILRKQRADVIHTHMYVADILGQLAGKLAGVKKRVYTRHSSNENRKYHKKSRIDRFVNRHCTHILAISENVKHILVSEEKVKPEKIRLIHHGFDLERFQNVSPEEIRELAAKYNPENRTPVIGVVARYSHWKGIQYIIGSFKKILADYPSAILILANARKGDYKNELASMLATLTPASYREIEFEQNLFALYRLFDIYVHVPIDPELEAFGQTYVEALAAGIPSVFTLSGVAREFIQHEKNALVVDFQHADQISVAISRLLADATLRETLQRNGKEDVKKLFTLERMIGRLETLYAE
jgi:glycosyltransferase involved in cell wall biosynthesis